MTNQNFNGFASVVLISNMTLLILLFPIKLLSQLNFFKHVEKKRGRLLLENVSSLEKIKRK